MIICYKHFHTDASVVTANLSSSISVVDGYNITLSCTSSGSPPDKFTWMKDGDSVVLQSTNITAVEHTNTIAVFNINYTITDFSISDSGTYTCNVTNPIGSNSTTITVNLRKLFCVVTDHFVHIYSSTKGFVLDTLINTHRCVGLSMVISQMPR